MVGTIIGDVIGSTRESHNVHKKDFKSLIVQHQWLGSKCTDDTIMSCAIAQAILDCHYDYTNFAEKARERMCEFYKYFAKHYAYGTKFKAWLESSDPEPYGDVCDGAAMKISPVGYAARSLEEAKELAKAVTELSHNSPEGLKAAEAVATTIYLARQGATMEELRAHVAQYYNIDFTIDEIHYTYCPKQEDFRYDCESVLPQAFEAFFESTSVEDAIRNAICIGGDSDTLAAIAGGLAEAVHKVPQSLRDLVLPRLTIAPKEKRLLEILEAFEKEFGDYTIPG